MKLNKIFWALMVVALPLSFTACSSSDDDGVNNDTTPYYYSVPKNKASQGKYTFDVSNSSYNGQASVSLDANKTITLKFPKKQSISVKAYTRTEATQEYDYVIGDYVKAGNVYTIKVGGAVWGTVTITPSGNGTYKIKIETVKPEDNDKNVVEVDAEKVQPISQNDDTDKLCRTWKPIGIRLLVLEQGKTGGKGFKAVNECSFKAVKAAAAEEGCTIDEDFDEGYLMTAVSFNNTGDLTIKFNKEENSYVAVWSWRDQNIGGNPRYINTTWSKKQAKNGEDNQFIPDFASILYQTGNFSGECWVEFDKVVESNDKKKYDVSLIVRLRDMAEYE